MLTQYIRAGMRRASYELLDDGTFFGTIPGFQGLWANGDTLETCRLELRSVFEDWLLLALREGDDLPTLDGICLNLAQTA
ncbi:MAG: type II toxin-antitoxin system HicB family antitoxin [Chloroflexota bacterium]|nr:type II toxin-antitoxin system HicB family antitoxin [Chloroflexota bacterium]MDE2884864.1 type II toxin-antitoxin system HicB family antitoxin [Chloroflexota bacterium]